MNSGDNLTPKNFFSKKIKPQEISAGQRDFYARPAAQSPPSRTRHDGIPRREEERRGRTGGTHMRDHVGSRRVAADLVQRVFRPRRHRRRPAPRRRSPPSSWSSSSSRGVRLGSVWFRSGPERSRPVRCLVQEQRDGVIPKSEYSLWIRDGLVRGEKPNAPVVHAVGADAEAELRRRPSSA